MSEKADSITLNDMKKVLTKQCSHSNWHTNFDPYEYSNRNYGEVRKSDIETIRHLIKLYLSSPKEIDVLDVGTGPNIIPLMTALSRAKTITAYEYSDNNIRYLKDILNNDELPEHWVKWWSQINELKKEVCDEQGLDFISEFEPINDPLKALRGKLKVEQGSIYDLNQFIQKRNGRKFDFIQTFYYAESIIDDSDEYNKGIKELSGALKNNGILAMAFMINSTSYNAGTGKFLALPMNADTVKKSLTGVDIDIKFCEKIEGESHVNPDGTIRSDVGLGFSHGTKC